MIDSVDEALGEIAFVDAVDIDVDGAGLRGDALAGGVERLGGFGQLGFEGRDIHALFGDDPELAVADFPGGITAKRVGAKCGADGGEQVFAFFLAQAFSEGVEAGQIDEGQFGVGARGLEFLDSELREGIAREEPCTFVARDTGFGFAFFREVRLGAERQEEMVLQIRHDVAGKAQRRREAFRALQLYFHIVDAAFFCRHAQKLADQDAVLRGNNVHEISADEAFRP